MLRWFDTEARRQHWPCQSRQRRRAQLYRCNLAVVFSQLGERTLLIDADLRNSPARTVQAGPQRRALRLMAGRANTEAVVRVPRCSALGVARRRRAAQSTRTAWSPCFLELLQSISSE